MTDLELVEARFHTDSIVKVPEAVVQLADHGADPVSDFLLSRLHLLPTDQLGFQVLFVVVNYLDKTEKRDDFK